MKKIFTGIFCLLFLLLLTGCGNMDNTPTKKTEKFLNSYKTLDANVVNQMNDIINIDPLMNDTQKDEYKEILKKQYKDLTYTIKDETVDGDTAVVTVEIEVYDFYKVNNESDIYYSSNTDEFTDQTGNISQYKYTDYRLDKLRSATDKVKYTIDFTLRKVDNNWILEDIDEITREKIHGLYAY